ncbi:MAG: ribulose-phosphate 3-epimerase [Candidatus Izemoplasmatales bacterium]|jgi:ribulose-phosphate 3-epimerase|nr:ribulose-phosphate 3-epimerase [Candidatus Izemoplasmatales bacterium]
MIVSPSFLSSDFSKLKEEILSINNAKWLHFDVMDGLFVENKTYDHKLINEIKDYSNQFFDVHLMIEKPEMHIDKYVKSGADLITFHYEATSKPEDLIKKIKDKNVKAGISIKPDTPVFLLDQLLNELDLILIMSVEPGKGGQKFIPNSIEKIEYLNKKRIENNYNYLIEVDGGINKETAKTVMLAGCDVIVVGSYIFNSDNRKELIGELENV